MARAGAVVVGLAGAIALGVAGEAQCNAARRGSVDVIVGAQWGDEVNAISIYNYSNMNRYSLIRIIYGVWIYTSEQFH
jgi:hypothetical protein